MSAGYGHCRNSGSKNGASAIDGVQHLRHAQVFVAELGEEVQPATLDSLARVAPYLAGRLAREMNLKYAPKLRFEPDTSFAYAAKIDSLLSEGLKPHRPQAGDSADARPGDVTDGGER